MKVCVFGMGNFPFGKKALPDERLKKIAELYRAQKITQIQVEFTTEKDIKTSDAIIVLEENKLDLIILDMEVVEGKLEKQPPEQEAGILKRAQALLEKETPLSAGDFSDEERKWLSNNNFVTIKPVIFISKPELDDIGPLVKRAYVEGGRI
jgi:hypothetical protein